jgi:hypothetical protein
VWKQRLISATLLSAIPVVCFAEPHPCVGAAPLSIAGPINRLMVAAFEQAPPESYVIITSAGGDADSAFAIARLERKKNIRVIVRDICLSACAEFILPSAKYVYFEGSPIVGFHGGDLIFAAKAAELGTFDHCTRKRLRETAVVYRKRRLNKDFFLKVAAKIIIEDYKLPTRHQCDASMRSRYLFWAPSSIQLKNGWGLRFTGTVCSDSAECISKVPQKLFRRGLLLMDDTSVDIGALHDLSAGGVAE